MLVEPIDIVMNNNEKFTIDTPTLTDSGRTAVRVWQDGVVINDPKAMTYNDVEEAFNAGMDFIKARKGK